MELKILTEEKIIKSLGKQKNNETRLKDVETKIVLLIWVCVALTMANLSLFVLSVWRTI